MSALRALTWADARIARAVLRGILRSPGRLAVWISLAIMTGALLVLRVRLGGSGAPTTGDLARADSVVALSAGLFGVTLALPKRFVGLFRHRAEARFIATAPIDPGVAIAYVHAREAASRALRALLSFAFTMLALAPNGVSVATLVRDALLALVVTALGIAVALPRELAPRPLAWLATAGGAALAVLAATIVVRDALVALHPSSAAVAFAQRLPAVHPGVVLLEASPWRSLAAIAVCTGLVAACCHAAAVLGRSRVPELYAMSLDRIDVVTHRQRRRAERTARRDGPRTSRSRRGGPMGAPAFAWKSWLEYRRQATPGGVALRFGIPFVTGFALGRFVHQPALMATILGMGLNLMVLWVTFTGAVLTRELRRPIFWLSGATVFERLVFSVAGAWTRTATFGWCAAAGAAAAIAPPYVIAVFAVGLPAIALLCVGSGTAIVAIFPTPIDQRGPGAVLRPLLAYATLVPAIAAFGVAAYLLGVMPAIAAGAAIALVEGFALLALAAWRFDGHVDRITTL